MTLLRVGCAILLWAAVLPAQAAERWIGHQIARVSIDANGQVSTVNLINSTLGKTMQVALVERVRQVEFEPAKLNGTAASAQVTVSIELQANAQADALTLSVSNVAVIPGLRKSSAPRFPKRELRKGVSGKVELAVKYDGNGRVTAVAPAAADAPMDSFMQAALKAARNWEFEPEQVAGIGVPGAGIVPVSFSIAGDELPGARSGDLSFPDGGVLRVYETAEAQWEIAQSQVRVRSIEGAQQAISGS